MSRRKRGNLGSDGYMEIVNGDEEFAYNPPPGRSNSGYHQSDFFQSPRCHEGHPDLHIGGGILVGGNCQSHLRHSGVSLYVALDEGMKHPYFDPDLSFWEYPVSVYYPIKNMQVPERPDKFSGLIDLIVGQLADGAKVHVGCIGGHGRTGMVIAAVVARLGIADEDDAIGWTRANYCKKAVENSRQEDFLIANFGCKPVAKKAAVDKRRQAF